MAELATPRAAPVMPFAVTPNHVIALTTGADEYWHQHHDREEYLIACYGGPMGPPNKRHHFLAFRCDQKGADPCVVYLQAYRPKRLIRSYQRLGDLTPLGLKT